MMSTNNNRPLASSSASTSFNYNPASTRISDTSRSPLIGTLTGTEIGNGKSNGNGNGNHRRESNISNYSLDDDTFLEERHLFRTISGGSGSNNNQNRSSPGNTLIGIKGEYELQDEALSGGGIGGVLTGGGGGVVRGQEGKDGKGPARRTSKACENCRVRRTKCAGGQPCKACTDLGLESTCVVRAKARPNRALPKLLSQEAMPNTIHEGESSTQSSQLPLQSLPTASGSGNGSGSSSQSFRPQLGRRHAQFVEDVELSLEAWAASRGQPLNLALPSSSILSQAFALPLIPLPHTPQSVEHELSAVEIYNKTSSTFMDLIPPQRLVDLTHRYHSSPNSLAPDQKALVLACICIGIFRNRCFPDNIDNMRLNRGEEGAIGEEVVYARHAFLTLDNWGSASGTALCALHCLHLWFQVLGGLSEGRDILGRMAWQVTELGIHRHATARLYPPSERVERLFYMTLYKDSWYASLCGEAPFLRFGEYDADFSKPNRVDDFDRGIDAYPFLVKLTLLENELLTLANTGKEFTPDFVFQTEGRWGEWMSIFRDEQVLINRPILYAFANIRFHWLRLMLRAPLLSHPHLRLSSLAILSRSVVQILNSYASFAHTSFFLPTWGEVRRISTAGYLMCICYWEREMERTEAETLAGVADALLSRLEIENTFALGARGNLRKLCTLLDLTPKAPTDSPAPFILPENSRNPLLFDYSLPASMDPWFDGALLDFGTNAANSPAPNNASMI